MIDLANDRSVITEKLSEMVSKKLSSRTKYWADEVLTEPTNNHNSTGRVDFMAFYPSWNNDSPSMVTHNGTFEFYEVKSCYQDFKSGNGLNFEGDINYLVCTQELAQQLYLKRELPRGICVLCPDNSWKRLIKKFDTRQGFSLRKRSTEELLFCLLQRIAYWR